MKGDQSVLCVRCSLAWNIPGSLAQLHLQVHRQNGNATCVEFQTSCMRWLRHSQQHSCFLFRGDQPLSGGITVNLGCSGCIKRKRWMYSLTTSKCFVSIHLPRIPPPPRPPSPPPPHTHSHRQTDRHTHTHTRARALTHAHTRARTEARVRKGERLHSGAYVHFVLDCEKHQCGIEKGQV